MRNLLNKFKREINEYILRYERLLSESDLFCSVDDYKFDTYTVSQLLQYVSDDSFWFQKKIVLAIGIRFKAEEYLYSKLIEAGMTVDQLFFC